MARKRHLSARGKEINFDELFLKNQKTIAITGGGAAMNAKGDTLGPGGKIIKTVEERDKVSNPQPAPENIAYNESNPNAVRQISIKDNIDDLTSLIPEAQVKDREEVEAAKTPAQVMQEVQAAAKAVADSAEMTVKSNNAKKERKIIDTDE